MPLTSAQHAAAAAIVVPVKPFAAAKQRLAPLLSAPERVALARAMLEDVLAVVTDASLEAAVFVVTADAQVAEIALAGGAGVVAERWASGMSHAVCRAVPEVRRTGAATMLVLPGDVPLLAVEDVRRIIGARADERDVVLAPARRDGGTNAVACAACLDMPLRFGHDSFQRHIDAAGACGLAARRLTLERVALDIDTPADVEALLARPGATRAQRLLRSLALRERIVPEALS